MVKRQRDGGRKYVALNRARVAAAALRTLLDVLAAHYGAPIVPQIRYRHGLPLSRDPRPPLAEDRMFGSPIRSRMLVLLAGSAKPTKRSSHGSSLPIPTRSTTLPMRCSDPAF